MRPTPAVKALDYLIESCWLLALVAVPIFFDTMTVRIFEPDKIALFRNIVIVMVIAVLVRAVLAAPVWMTRSRQESEGPQAPWWRATMRRWPLLLPVIIFALIYCLATATSVLPGISLWGSYDRMQGLYTWLTYMAFFAIVAFSLRSWSQIERIVSALVLASIPVAAYGIIQHLQWDQIQWGADTSSRVASTLGNSIFLGAYLLMCMPFTIYRLVTAFERWRVTPQPSVPATPARRNRPPDRDVIEIDLWPPIMPVIGYALTLLLSFAALYYSGSRGPYYGFLAGELVLGIALTLKLSNPWPAIASFATAAVLYAYPQLLGEVNPTLATVILVVCIVAIVLVLVLPQVQTALRPALGSIALAILIFSFPQSINIFSTVATNATDASHLSDFSVSGTSEVRQYIWEGSVGLIKERPILGWGPETMIYVYSKYYPSGLGHIERANAAPDRNHDELLDFLVFSGVLGLLAWLAILATFTWMIYSVMRRARTRWAIIIAACVLAAVAGHFVEGLVGIGVVSTLMLEWTMFAIAAALYARPELIGDIPALEPAAVPATAAPERVLAAAGAGRNGGRQGTATTTTTNRRPARPQPQRPAPVQRVSFDRLSGGQQGMLLGLIVLVLVAAVGGILLFANNVQVVRADANYKIGQSNDTVAVACLNRAANANTSDVGLCPAGSATQKQIDDYAGLQLLPTAINYYEQVIAMQPSQDMYYLWLGKTDLDEARYYQSIGQLQNSFQFFQQAEDILKQARALNPRNADHPMNLGRMFAGWAQYDTSKWALADSYYRIATALARHNGRWWDEWGSADMKQANPNPPAGVAHVTLTPAQRTALYHQALAAFQHACQVDDLLGDARIYRGQAYAVLGMYKQAAASFQEALKTQGFEIFSNADAIQGWVSTLYNAKEYRALVTTVNLGGDLKMQSPLTLAYSPTLGLAQPTSPLTPTLQAISVTLKEKGIAG